VSFKVGDIIWTDLTVEDASGIRDFYSKVVGWKHEVHPECEDFNLFPPDRDREVAGICYAKGINEGFPAQWLNYVVVKDLDESIRSCIELGGKVIKEPSPTGNRVCVIQDPAGAYIALLGAR